MKKQSLKKKMSLTRETVGILQDRQIELVVGRYTTSADGSVKCGSDTCACAYSVAHPGYTSCLC